MFVHNKQQRANISDIKIKGKIKNIKMYLSGILIFHFQVYNKLLIKLDVLYLHIKR